MRYRHDRWLREEKTEDETEKHQNKNLVKKVLEKTLTAKNKTQIEKRYNIQQDGKLETIGN